MEQMMTSGGAEVGELKGMLQRVLEINIGTSEKVNALDGKVSQMERRMDGFEFNEEITYAQQQVLNDLIHKTVYARLGIGMKRSEWSEEEQLVNAKYFKLFSKRLRKEVSDKGHLAFPFRTTRKGNYQLACEDVEAWYPRYGTDALKKEADDAARARRIAREQGYEG